jgi:hypothetical protein
MSLALESEKLLREIRDLRDQQRRQFDLDLAEIDHAYELQVGRIKRSARSAWLATAALWIAIATALAVVGLIAR